MMDDIKECRNCLYEFKDLDDGPCKKCNLSSSEWKSGEIDSDVVIAPTHYTSGNIECIDAIRSALTEEEFRGYCKGNVIKYTWRERIKGKDEDLKKAKQYIEFIEVKR